MKQWKRAGSTMLALMLLSIHTLLFIPVGYAAGPTFAGGSGTAEDPYIIKTLEQLDAVRHNLSAHYLLAADIDASDTVNWNSGAGFTPIGDMTSKFMGTFNGQWFKITGLTINLPSFRVHQVGLFGVVGHTGEIHQVTLADVTVTGYRDVGALVGRLEGGKITNSKSSGHVNGSDWSTGGLVGWSSGTIDLSSTAGEVRGRDQVGGLVGHVSNGTVTRSYSTSEVYGTSYGTGGLVGELYLGTVAESFASGTVNGSYNTGGLVGGVSGDGKVSLSYASGDVHGSANTAGGLVGRNTGEIVQSYATGNVSGKDNVGGLVGHSYNSSTTPDLRHFSLIRQAYATGDVRGDTGIGGLIGHSLGRIEQSYATGPVMGQAKVGGLVGDNSAGEIMEAYAISRVDGDEHTGGLTGRVSLMNRVERSFYDYEISGQWADGDDGRRGTARTTAEMRALATFIGANWDFADVWQIDPAVNDGYPGLKRAGADPILSLVMVQADGMPYVNDTWTNQAVTLKAQAFDRDSGISSLMYSEDGGVTWYTLPESGVTYHTSGTSIITIKAVDLTGREAFATRIIKISHHDLQIEIRTRQQSGVPYVAGDWTSQSVTASVYASNQMGLDITSLVYSLDEGITWSSYDHPLTFDSEGIHALRVKASDEAGNEQEDLALIRIDRTQPDITIGTNGSAGYGQLAASIVTISDADSGADASSLYYAWSMDTSRPSAGWQPFANGERLTKSGVSGDWVLHIQAQDGAGNVSYAVSERFRLDHVAPTLDVSLRMDEIDANTWIDQRLAISAEALDALSGIAAMTYSLDGGHTWSRYDTENLSREMLQPISIKAIDEAGNDTVVSWNLGMLTIGTSNLALRPDVEEADGRIIIRLHADAGADQIDTMAYIVNGERHPYMPGDPIELELGKAASLQFQLLDTFGNRITASLSLRGRQTPPTVHFSPNGREAWSANAASTVTVDKMSASTALSYAWSTDTAIPTSGWQPFMNGDTLHIDEVSGEWYLHVLAQYDGSSYYALSQRFRVDHEGPTIQLHAEKSDGDSYVDDTWVDQPVTISADAADDYSGVRSFEYSLDGGSSWSDYTTPLMLLDDGIYRVVFRAVDEAGNETAARRTVRISSHGLVLTVTAEEEDGASYVNGSWVSSGITVRAHANSISDRIVDFTYRMNDGSEQPYVQDTPLRIDQEGMTKLMFRVTDTTGQTLSDEWQVRIDQTAPRVSFGTNGNDNESVKASSAVHVIDDIEGMDVSGLDPSTLRYAWSQSVVAPTSGWQPFVNGEILEKTNVNGDWYLHIQAQDVAGNSVTAVSNRFRLAVSGNGGSGGTGGGWFGGVVLSDNADLKRLSVWTDGLELPLLPTFAPDITEYTLSIAAEWVEVSVAPAHASATVKLREQTVDGPLKLQLNRGANTYVFTVEAENGKQKKYTLVIHRMPIFIDIAGHWAEEEILRAAELGIVRGYPDDTFRPNHSVTRAEFTVMAAGALRLLGDGETLMFTDRGDIGDWAQLAVAQSVQQGIVQGYPDGRFLPNAHILRAEMALIIARALGLVTDADGQPGFVDDGDIPDWASGAVEALRIAGVVAGRSNNYFAPREHVTRAEATVMLLRMLDRLPTTEVDQKEGH